ncbi:unnamed protein product [Pseudo-nitzschia multistriata]|uniref:Uncharacterized protein n=1 Tax=Pseudo-nitzschia multistriata TaxID=183589 RepID=A0A448YWG0_9STRA|nr:unnamed protein product [Pseudo-nitzschia multistriata]
MTTAYFSTMSSLPPPELQLHPDSAITGTILAESTQTPHRRQKCHPLKNFGEDSASWPQEDNGSENDSSKGVSYSSVFAFDSVLGVVVCSSLLSRTRPPCGGKNWKDTDGIFVRRSNSINRTVTNRTERYVVGTDSSIVETIDEEVGILICSDSSAHKTFEPLFDVFIGVSFTMSEDEDEDGSDDNGIASNEYKNGCDDPYEKAKRQLALFFEKESAFPEDLRSFLKGQIELFVVHATSRANAWLCDLAVDHRKKEVDYGRHIRAVAEVFPDSLLHRSSSDHSTCPITAACGHHLTVEGPGGECLQRRWVSSCETIRYVPLLARLGQKHHKHLYGGAGGTDRNHNSSNGTRPQPVTPERERVRVQGRNKPPRHRHSCPLTPLRTALEHLTNCTEEDEQGDSPSHQHAVDVFSARAMERLRESGLLSDGDIERCNLVDVCLLRWGVPRTLERLRFLVGVHPGSLRAGRRGDLRAPSSRATPYTRAEGDTLLHASVKSSLDRTDLGAFRCVLELGIEHFAADLGFLFHANPRGATPYRLACAWFGVHKTLSAVRAVVVAGGAVSGESFLRAASDPEIHLDSLQFQLEQCPSLLPQLLGRLPAPPVTQPGTTKRKRAQEPATHRAIWKGRCTLGLPPVQRKTFHQAVVPSEWDSPRKYPRSHEIVTDSFGAVELLPPAPRASRRLSLGR